FRVLTGEFGISAVDRVGQVLGEPVDVDDHDLPLGQVLAIPQPRVLLGLGVVQASLDRDLPLGHGRDVGRVSSCLTAFDPSPVDQQTGTVLGDQRGEDVETHATGALPVA